MPNRRLVEHVEFVTGSCPELVGEELIANFCIMHNKVLDFRNWLNKSLLGQNKELCVSWFSFLAWCGHGSDLLLV